MTGAGGSFDIRAATTADLASAFAVGWRCDHGVDAAVPLDPRRWRYLAHELATGRLAVAEIDGEVVGFGGVVTRGGTAMIADLFVDPGAHGRGIGGALLAEVLGDTWPRQTFSSGHPNALPLYVRAGMVPRWPLLYLRGDPRSLTSQGRTRAHAANPASLAAIEVEWFGLERPEDHRYWGDGPGATGVEIRRADTTVGFAYLSRDPWDPVDRWAVSSMGVRSAQDIVEALAAVFDLAVDIGCASLGLALPGPSPATVPLMRAGFRLTDRDTYVASAPELLDPGRRIPNPGLA